MHFEKRLTMCSGLILKLYWQLKTNIYAAVRNQPGQCELYFEK